MQAGVVVAAGFARDEKCCDLCDLLGAEDAVLVERAAGVVEQVRVGL